MNDTLSACNKNSGGQMQNLAEGLTRFSAPIDTEIPLGIGQRPGDAGKNALSIARSSAFDSNAFAFRGKIYAKTALSFKATIRFAITHFER